MRPDFAELDLEQRQVLRTGQSFFDCETAFKSIDELSEAWELHRDAIMAEHISEYPCTRPFAWWLLEHRQERPVWLNDWPKLDEWRAAKFGYLHTSAFCKDGFLQEPERSYLERNDLLDAGELERFEQQQSERSRGLNAWQIARGCGTE